MQDQPPSSSLSSSNWTINYSSKLNFFLKIRRLFLHPKKPTKNISLPHDSTTTDNHNYNINIAKPTLETQTEEKMQEKTEKIELVDQSGALQKAVKELLFGKCDEDKENAVKEIKRLASQSVKMRKSLGELGVIPPLVSMLNYSHHTSLRQLAVQALTQLSDGTFTNKALILEAGILTKLPTNIEEVDEPLTNYLSQLLMSISSVFTNNAHFPFNQSTLISYLLNIIQSNSIEETTKEASLGTLHNLSTVLEVSGQLISNRVVNILLSLLSSSKEKIPELALAILGNLVVTLKGKKALEDNAMMPDTLIDILTWEDRPKCQELSVYVLMILAHQSSKQRDKMARSGIVHTLLEVALLGTPLAQKRALKLIQWFKDERQLKVGPHSGPQMRSLSMGSPVSDGENSESKRLMKMMVQQSLDKNMEVITRRANVAGETSKLKSLIISSSSKSLPY